MNRIEFLQDADVTACVDWLAERCTDMPVHLRIKGSPFVPGGINSDVNGLNAVLELYQWRGGWADTLQTLEALAADLRNAVARESDEDALAACGAIVDWGGNRDARKGAYPFLEAKVSDAGDLCSYLREAGTAFCLHTADLERISPPVLSMNSMLTKVHALYATDGLPIYDSRVAAAIATLVECWRVAEGRNDLPLPPALAFPATSRARMVTNLIHDAQKPGVMIYGAADTPSKWSSAKIRLGWILEAVLIRVPPLFANYNDLPRRMHAFEASLFMMGSDVTCLSPLLLDGKRP